MARKLYDVALLIETSRAVGRGILQGVCRYLSEHRTWSVYFERRDLGAAPPRWLNNWRGDGVLARIDNLALGKAVKRMGLPAVDLRVAYPELGLPSIGVDNRAIVELAFEHLADRGFQQFGFCGVPRGQNIWLDFRGDEFARIVRGKGLACHVYGEGQLRSGSSLEGEQRQLSAWIARLPKPIGVLACDDERGGQVLEACRRTDVQVPDELAVMGVENDEILCNLSNPPLSSVDYNPNHVGYEAAKLLNSMMAGRPAPKKTIFLPPRGVVARHSTDVLAIADRDLAQIVRFIREHACEGLRLNEVLRQTSLSQRTLERRMQQLLGRSPKEEITRMQMLRAKQLLCDTNQTVAAVAKKCGFSQPKYFGLIFRAQFGLPPGAYRKKMQR